MKLPPYRLQPVLDKRQRAKEDAEKALGAAQKALEAEMQKEAECVEAIEKIKRTKEEAKAEMNKKMLEGQMGVSDIQQHKNYLKSLDFEIQQARERLEQQREQVKRAEQAVAQKREALMEATKEFQAIEKHRENWVAQIKKEREEAEAKEQEEIGNVLFLQRQRKD
jgi:flagellar export protein FliJ